MPRSASTTSNGSRHSKAGDAQACRELSDETSRYVSVEHAPVRRQRRQLLPPTPSGSRRPGWLSIGSLARSWWPETGLTRAATSPAQMTPRSGGDVTHFSGNYLRILRRQADGGWKMIREMADQRPARPTGQMTHQERCRCDAAICVSIISLLMVFAWPAFGQNAGKLAAHWRGLRRAALLAAHGNQP